MKCMRHLTTVVAVILACAASLPAPPARAAGIGDMFHRLAGSPKSTLVDVVLVDQSASIDPGDRALYDTLFRAIVDSKGQCDRLKPGSRVILGAIADRPASRFDSKEFALPDSGVGFDDQEAAAAVCPKLKAHFASLLSPPRPVVQSYILDALFAVAPIVGEGQDARLFVASDMVEEAHWNFARQPVDAALAARILSELKARGTLPSLRGARVYVVGAGGKSAEDFVRIRSFWEAYFKATGATLVHYGRTVPMLK